MISKRSVKFSFIGIITIHRVLLSRNTEVLKYLDLCVCVCVKTWTLSVSTSVLFTHSLTHSLIHSLFCSTFSDGFQKCFRLPLFKKQSKCLETMKTMYFFLKMSPEKPEENKSHSTTAIFLFICPSAPLHRYSLQWEWKKFVAGISVLQNQWDLPLTSTGPDYFPDWRLWVVSSAENLISQTEENTKRKKVKKEKSPENGFM